MYDLPLAASRLLSTSHGVTARLLASVNGSSFTYPVVFESGSVRVSASSPVTRQLSAKIRASIGDPEVDVFRTELRAEYGLVGIDGVTYWVPVGVFVVTDADEASPGVVDIKADDRWRRVVNARFLAPVSTSGSTVAAITSLLQGADSRIVVSDLTSSPASHPVSVWDRDRDKAVLDLAKSIGAEVVFDAVGTAVIRPVADITDPVRWRIYGGDGGVLVQARQSTTQGNTYNAVVAESNPVDGSAPVRAVTQITDPGSPLIYGGAFASRPRFYRSPLITTVAQAQSAANSLLERVRGVARTVSADIAPHPGLDAGDVVVVEVTPSLFERHIVDGFDLPLGPGGVQLATRTDVERPGE